MTESVHGLRESFRPLTAIALAGTVALSGCTAGSPKPEHAPAIAVTYTAPEGADALPLLTEHRALPQPQADTYVDAGLVASRKKEAGAFEWLSNTNPDPNGPKAMDLPGGRSAPVVDIMMGSDGKLRYKVHSKEGYPNTEENKLLGAAATAGPMLLPAFRSGKLSKLHFRVHTPRDPGDDPALEHGTEVMFIPNDYTEGNGGKPSVYYYLPPRGMVEMEGLELVTTHEVAHALTDPGNKLPPLTAEQAKAFGEACDVMQADALELVRQENYTIVGGLWDMKRMTPKRFWPAFDKVIKSLQDGSYAKLPTDDPNAKGGVPNCYLQNPWTAVVQVIREMKIDGGNLPKEMQGDDFEAEADEVVEDWHDLVKQSDVYLALSESSHVERKQKELGHPYDNIHELRAGTTNLLLRRPSELGEHAAKLSPDLRAPLDAVIKLNLTFLKEQYGTDKEFMDLIDKQYQQYLQKAN